MADERFPSSNANAHQFFNLYEEIADAQLQSQYPLKMFDLFECTTDLFDIEKREKSATRDIDADKLVYRLAKTREDILATLKQAAMRNSKIPDQEFHERLVEYKNLLAATQRKNQEVLEAVKADRQFGVFLFADIISRENAVLN